MSAAAVPPEIPPGMTVAIVGFSGGASSWLAARIVRDEQPTRKIVLLFADTLIEDEDTYRFLDAAAANIGVPLTRIAEGRTPWEVFRDKRFIGNNRVDPCSRILKREPLNAWIAERYGPREAEHIIGLDATEAHRLARFRARVAPRPVDAPLIRHGIWKDQVHARVEAAGLPRQRLYRMGAAHANCGGGCVKMGMSGWALLLERFPKRFHEWEQNEEAMRARLGRDVSILRDRKGGTSRPLTLREFRERRQTDACPFLVNRKSEAAVAPLIDFRRWHCPYHPPDMLVDSLTVARRRG